MEPNYKLIYNKLKDKYPEIAKELIPENPIESNFNKLSVFVRVCSIIGVTPEEIVLNRNSDSLRLFLGVYCLMFDPDYLKRYRGKLKNGLREKLTSILGMSGNKISYNLRKVKDWMDVYTPFENEVEHIYKRVKIELNEKERQREEVNG